MLLDVGGQDATEAFEDVGHSDEAREFLNGLFVGNLIYKVSLNSTLFTNWHLMHHTHPISRVTQSNDKPQREVKWDEMVGELDRSKTSLRQLRLMYTQGDR